MGSSTGLRARGACVAVAALALVAAACSGGSSVSGGDGQQNTLGFPLDGPALEPMRAVRAFPALTFERPVFATHAGDGSDRVFVVEQAGRIVVFGNDDRAAAATEVLDLRATVSEGGSEMGMLGLAFSPNHATDGLFYVGFNVGSPRRSRVSEFRVLQSDRDRADLQSQRVVLELEQPFTNHNGGMLAFGPDGYLYLSFGDGGSGGDPLDAGQDLGVLLGKILRIDPFRQDPGLAYAVPADNPFVGQQGARGEIWAYGLRNPWRFSFDAVTGEMWCGDVGQNAREEIDRIARGGNYGWRVFEGNLEFNNPSGRPASDFEAPVLDYPPGRGRAVVGGYVYRGTLLESLRGVYVYGDYTSGRVLALEHDDGVVVNDREIASVGSITSFGEDERGELLLVSHLGGLFRLEPEAGGGGGSFPTLLSETGIFTDLATLTPTPGVVEYAVQVPFWSDGAQKRRWLYVPGGGERIGFSPTDAWSFPLGTVLVKHFEIELRAGDPQSARRLETRALVHERGGWAGYTYRWNAQGTDADLLDTAATESLDIVDPAAPGGMRTVTWQYPSRADCLRCHTEARGRVLGVRTRQLSGADVPGAGTTGTDQLRALEQLSLFADPLGAGPFDSYPEVDDTAAPLAARARAYLAANCAHCHLPGGTGRSDLDLRFATPDAAMNAIDVAPQFGDVGLTGARIVAPGSSASSVLLERMRRQDEHRMPQLGTTAIDAAGVALIEAWIDSLPN